MSNLIEANNIGKSYAQTVAIGGVSLKIDQAEFVTIMGPSGSGKSSLLYALSGLETIDQGEVRFEEKDLKQMKEEELAALRRSSMGFVFQQPTLLSHLTLKDNIILPALRENKRSRSDVEKRVELLMEQVGIGELADRSITEVSGGQLQRAGICRALINQPKILFGDEPTGALNSQTTEEILELLQDIHRQGTAILLVSHDPVVAAHSQRVIFMVDGKIVDELVFDQSATDRLGAIKARMSQLGI